MGKKICRRDSRQYRRNQYASHGTHLANELFPCDDLLQKVGGPAVPDTGVESPRDGLPIGLASLLERGHGDPVGDVEHGRLVVLLHELSDSDDEGRVEGRVLLDLAVLVVDDRSVEACSGEGTKRKVADESTADEPMSIRVQWVGEIRDVRARDTLLARDGDDGEIWSGLANVTDGLERAGRRHQVSTLSRRNLSQERGRSEMRLTWGGCCGCRRRECRRHH